MPSNASTDRSLSADAVDAISFLLAWRRQATAEFAEECERVVYAVTHAKPGDGYEAIVAQIERGPK